MANSHLVACSFTIILCLFDLCDVTATQQLQSPCRADEFYDGVVGQCGLCRDICDIVFLRQSPRPCMLNCPEFYKNLNLQSEIYVQSTPIMTSFDRSSVDYMLQSSWMNNPLIWTTFVALLIAALATVAIAVLMVIFRRQRRDVRYSPVVESASRDSSSSTLTDRDRPQCLVTAPEVMVYESEKAGPPLLITSSKS